MRAQAAYREAEDLSRRSLRLIAVSNGEESAEYAIALGILASILSGQGHYWSAEANVERAVSIAHRTLGSGHHEYANLMSIRAEILWRRGGCGKAIRGFQQSISILENLPDADRVDLGQAYENLAAACVECNKLVPANTSALRALAILGPLLPTDHSAIISVRNTLMVLDTKQKKLDQAAALAPGLVDAARSGLGPCHPLLAMVLNNAAEVYEAQYRYREAADLLRQALAIK
jgi:tetratricopeptide (TPR) repeat protein